ncbi:MAG TPA: Crp/Fnr family transcriptional regulator [Acidobacteriaceae bacterium]|nr:Crp/Fnr family transcriptional regulator [Acidobacteriaceae bacterium]
MANSVKNGNSQAPRAVPDRCAQCTDRLERLFCNLPAEVIDRFDEIAMQISYPSRSVLFEEGQRAPGIFVVCSGQIKLAATSRDGRTMILRIAVPGDVLGLTATLNDQPCEVTAETLEPCQVRSVRRRDFLEFLGQFGEVSRQAAQVIAREYHEVFLDARRLALAGSAAGRLAQLLLDWANTSACGKPGLRFTMALTHEELANMAGTSRETVTRLLNQFERDELIARHGSTIVILRPTEMERMVG